MSEIKWKKIETKLYKNEVSAVYYSRLETCQGGKALGGFKSLRTKKLSVARLRLRDREREFDVFKKSIGRESLTVSDLKERYSKSLEDNTQRKESTKTRHGYNIKKVFDSWLELADLEVAVVTSKMCKEWASRIKTEPHGKVPP